MNVVIRTLQAADLANGYFETVSNLKPSAMPHDAGALLARMKSQDVEIFVALLDSQVVGAASVLIEQKLLAGGVRCAHVEDVATRTGFERRGIGRAVVDAAIAYARQRGCYKVVLDSGSENVAFYERLGFTCRGREMIIKL